MKELERKDDILHDPNYFLAQFNELSDAWKFNYLPLLIKVANINNLERVDYTYAPMVKLLIDVKILLTILEDKSTSYKDVLCFIKRQIKDHPMNLPEKSKPYADAMLHIYQVIISYLYSLIHDNKVMESAIFAYSPIVPYGQILEKVGETRPSIVCVGATDRENLLTNLLINNVWDIYIFANKYTFDLSSFKLDYDDNEDATISSIEPNMIRLLEDEIESEEALHYYINAYVNYFTGMEKAVGALTKYINSLTLPLSKSMDQLISNLEVIDDPAYEEWIMSTENVNNLEYLNDKNERRILNKVEVKDVENDKYDLNIILSYIYTNRRYMTNNYTNSLFTSTYKSIGGYTFINQNDMVVCEIDDNYLAVPVIDLADNYKMKLICMGADGKIVIRNFKDDMK